MIMIHIFITRIIVSTILLLPISIINLINIIVIITTTTSSSTTTATTATTAVGRKFDLFLVSLKRGPFPRRILANRTGQILLRNMN